MNKSDCNHLMFHWVTITGQVGSKYAEIMLVKSIINIKTELFWVKPLEAQLNDQIAGDVMLCTVYANGCSLFPCWPPNRLGEWGVTGHPLIKLIMHMYETKYTQMQKSYTSIVSRQSPQQEVGSKSNHVSFRFIAYFTDYSSFVLDQLTWLEYSPDHLVVRFLELLTYPRGTQICFRCYLLITPV